MTRYKIRLDARDYGSKGADWYMFENLPDVEAEDPVRVVGGRYWPAAYFVDAVERVRDDMRDFNPVYDQRITIAGPFATEDDAWDWVDENC